MSTEGVPIGLDQFTTALFPYIFVFNVNTQ
jgi:hypothetical protein